MRTRATTLGIIGEVIGVIVGIVNCILFIFTVRSAAWVGSGEIGLVIILISYVFIFAILGLVGGTIGKDKPVVGGALMLVGGI